MCGFVTIFDATGKRDIDQALLHRMTATIRHRGPDGEGAHVEPGLGLGHRRLAIIDVDGGHQPMYSNDGTCVVVFNGEIYNFQELRAELSGLGHRFKTNSDTEVILHAWQAWGAEFVKRLEGMFAFALWDSTKETLVLARDRLGKKPLYYATLPNGLLLAASELKALLCHPDVVRDDFDPLAIEDFFAYGYIPDPKTILRGVRKLPAAHILAQRRNNAPVISAYWDVSFAAQAMTVEEAEHDLLARLDDAVQKRLISDVPLGAFLSGGVDSSAVVARMAGMSEQPVSSFAIAFNDPAFDERRFADTVARQYGTDHHCREVDRDDLDLIGKLTEIFDEPFGDSSALPTFRLSELSRQHVKVCLSGDGADEAFAGYRRYLWHHREEQVRSMLPGALRRPVFSALAQLYPKLDWAPRALRAKSTFRELSLDAEQAYFNSVSVTDDDLRTRLMSAATKRDLQGYHAADVVISHMLNADTNDPVQQAQYADLKTYLSGDVLVKVDRASMANSLEVRTPFLDHDFVEWAINLPTEMKLRGVGGKWLLKEALQGVVPRENLHRPKMGFSVPLAAWFRDPLLPEIRRVGNASALSDSGIFEMPVVNQLIEDHASQRRDHGAVLWLLLMFDSFLLKTVE